MCVCVCVCVCVCAGCECVGGTHTHTSSHSPTSASEDVAPGCPLPCTHLCQRRRGLGLPPAMQPLVHHPKVKVACTRSATARRLQVPGQLGQGRGGVRGQAGAPQTTNMKKPASRS